MKGGESVCAWIVAAVVAVTGLSAAPPTTTLTADFSKTPVLFVHGSGLGSRSWDQMIEYLGSAGYPTEYLLAVDLVPRNGSNVRAAEELIAPAVERLISTAARARHVEGLPPGAEKVDIVAHSMGAFSSRWFAAKLAPHRVRTWIGLAGSNHGSDALRGLEGAGNEEMVPAFSDSPGGDLQTLLNGTRERPLDETPFGLGADRRESPRVPTDETRSILYLSLFIDPDRWIQPTTSALLDGAGGVAIDLPPDLPVKRVQEGNFLLGRPSDHDRLPEEPDAIALVARFLALRDG